MNRDQRRFQCCCCCLISFVFSKRNTSFLNYKRGLYFKYKDFFLHINTIHMYAYMNFDLLLLLFKLAYICINHTQTLFNMHTYAREFCIFSYISKVNIILNNIFNLSKFDFMCTHNNHIREYVSYNYK